MGTRPQSSLVPAGPASCLFVCTHWQRMRVLRVPHFTYLRISHLCLFSRCLYVQDCEQSACVDEFTICKLTQLLCFMPDYLKACFSDRGVYWDRECAQHISVSGFLFPYVRAEICLYNGSPLVSPAGFLHSKAPVGCSTSPSCWKQPLWCVRQWREKAGLSWCTVQMGGTAPPRL